MEKKIKKANMLIKKKNLIIEMKKLGIKRVSMDSILPLEKYFKEKLSNLISALKEEMIINGRKTLKKEDIKKILEKEEEFWEI